MGRSVPQDFLDAMAADVFAPLIFVEFEFDSGDLNIWNGIGDITIASTTYTGTGDLLSVSAAEETSQVVSRGMSISLSGVPASLFSLAINEPFQGRSCVVRWGYEGSTSTVILFSGFIDKMDIKYGADTAIISVLVENELASLDRAVKRFYSDQSHKSRFPTDEFFSHVTELSDKELQWGGGHA